MKKLIILLTLMGSLQMMQAQRIAYIESEYILERVTPYKQSKERLEKQSQEWQKEIEKKMKDLDELYKKFQAEQALYTDAIKKQKIDDIEKREREIGELQKQRFGPSGDIFNKRQEMIQPIINQMFDEVKKIAESKSFDMVLDKSNGNAMVYVSSKLNISDQVIKSMGY